MNWDELIHDGANLLAVVLLVLLNAFFVAAELALVRIRDTQLAALAAKGNRRAKMARHIVSHIDTYISTTQFGITLASMALGVVIEPVFRDLLNPLFGLFNITSLDAQRGIAIGVGFFVNCYLLIVAGELVPKAIAIRRTLQTSLWVAAPLNWFYRLSYPFIWLLHRSSQFVVRRLGFSAEELRSAPFGGGIAAGARLDAGAPGAGRNLILNALDLRHRVVREVMRPRHEITAFNTAASLAECLALAEETRYSRFPLCENGDLDRTRGVVHIKDLYPACGIRRGRRRICCPWRASWFTCPKPGGWKNCCNCSSNGSCTLPWWWMNTAAPRASPRWKMCSKNSSARFRTNSTRKNRSWCA